MKKKELARRVERLEQRLRQAKGAVETLRSRTVFELQAHRWKVEGNLRLPVWNEEQP